jgi:hypothetical protein
MKAAAAPQSHHAFQEPHSWRHMLRAKVVRNEAARVLGDPRHELRITVEQKQPSWLVPPLSWMIRPSSEKEVRLDRSGCEVYELCNGHRTVEELVDLFADRHRLTFHEARVAITNYLYALVQRGVLVLAIPEENEAV